jgi:hypothetical protein
MCITRRLLLMIVIGAACGTSDKAPTSHLDSTRIADASPDCLGPGMPQIDVGRVGNLHLDLPLREIARKCSHIRDSTARGDESLDTAIVISRPGLTVVGRVANIANDEVGGPYHVDSAATILSWTISGSSAMLPLGVPLSASWDSLVTAFGTPAADPLNGDVYIWFCKTLPDFILHFDDPLYRRKPELISRESFPAALRGSRIREVDLPSRHRRNPACQP